MMTNDFFKLYREWRQQLDLFNGTPADILPEIYQLMERIAPHILHTAQLEHWQLYYLEGYTQEQIADYLGMAQAGSISISLNKARRKLWDLMCEIIPSLAEAPWKEFFMPPDRDRMFLNKRVSLMKGGE